MKAAEQWCERATLKSSPCTSEHVVVDYLWAIFLENDNIVLAVAARCECKQNDGGRGGGRQKADGHEDKDNDEISEYQYGLDVLCDSNFSGDYII